MNRRYINTGLGLILVGAPSFSWSASTAAIRSVGYIISAQPATSLILIRGGQKIIAKRGELLFDGDLIEASEEAVEVVYWIYGKIIRKSAEMLPERVVARSFGDIDASDERYFESIKSIIYEPATAPNADELDRGQNKIDSSVQYWDLFPGGEHLIHSGTKEIFLAWKGGGGMVHVTTSDGEAKSLNSQGHHYITIKPQKNLEWLKIKMRDFPILWNITFKPKEYIERKSGVTPSSNNSTSRTRWAHQVLLSNSPACESLKIAAASIILDEAKNVTSHNVFATRIFQSIISGEISQKYQNG